MTLIRVAEQAREADGSFRARVSFQDGGDYDVTVADPLDAAQEARLAWYFEEHLRYPFLDREVAGRAVADLRECGEALFSQVFGDSAAAEYRSWAGRSFDGCRVQVQGSAAFHRLHWEALRDPALAAPLAVRMPLTRHVDGVGARFEVAAPGDTLNILVITARPDGARDVGYRTVSRPLLDGLGRADRPVRIELVRPGTWEALRDRLRAATQEHGSGFFHVVHFDLHGALAPFEVIERGRAEQRYLFGDTAREPYEGERGYLFFETAVVGRAHPVAAGQVAELLAEHRVPVAVLNACQSAKESVAEASLAQQLAEAGVPVSLGMAYSVTVTAAKTAMSVFYEELSRGLPPVQAGHAARRALYDTKARDAYFDQQLDLEDWALPVVFAQRPLQIDVTEMTAARQAAFFTEQAEHGEEPRPEYGFVGRDLEVHVLERAALLDPHRNIVLVQGMAGSGKSTLLQHLQWWWRRTGLVEGVFAFSYEQRPWNASQIVREIARHLLDPVEQAKLELMGSAAQTERVAGLLRARRYLLVLDNAESIAASPAAIPHSLPAEDQEELRRFLTRLRGGRTLVLLGSREAETWLSGTTFGDNVHHLSGLDEQAASVLIHRILARHGGTVHETDPTQRVALGELRKLLGGYPLPLTVVVPELATRTPTEVLADLEGGVADADPLGVITTAIEYSHGRLDSATQNSLLLLAPFTASIPVPALRTYQAALSEQDPVAALGPTDPAAAVAEATRVGLATPHPELQDWVQTLPVLPYFLRARLRHNRELRAALAQAHYKLFLSLGPVIGQLLLARDPQQRATGHIAAKTEYANLTAAIEHGLASSQPVLDLIRPLEELLDQTKQQPARRRLIDRALEAIRAPEQLDLRREQAELSHLAGMVAQEQRRFEDAEQAYRTALQLLLEFDDRHSAAATYHQLGTIAQDQRHFEDAEQAYRTAMQLFREFDDRHSAASSYQQLGTVALEQRRFEDAEQAYRTALQLYLEFDDRRSAASPYYQLGRVAHEQRRFENAAQHFGNAAFLWHSSTSLWHLETLDGLVACRAEIGENELRRVLGLEYPVNSIQELMSALDQLY